MVEEEHVIIVQECHQNSMTSLLFMLLQESTDPHTASYMLQVWVMYRRIYLVDD